MFRLDLVCSLCVVLSAAAAFAVPPEFQTLNIGDPAPAFELPGVDDQTHKLTDYDAADILMVIFTCNHCPTAQAYEERIKQLHAEYEPKGVQLVAISPNDPLAVRLDELGYTDLGDSLADMKLRAKQQEFKFPYLYDGENQRVSLSYGVLATPHVFIFDRDRRLRYKGRIDDSEVKTVTSHDARNALDALLAGQPVPVDTTRVFGCSTKWSDKRKNAEESIAKWDEEPVELSRLSKEELEQLSQNKSDKYRLFNVWATWCVPCVAELPELVTINRMYRGRNFELITISADNLADQDKALKLLKKLKVAAKNYLFASDDRDQLFDGLDKEWEGAVPYTVLIAPGGKVVHRQHGEFDSAKLKRAIADALGRTYASR